MIFEQPIAELERVVSDVDERLKHTIRQLIQKREEVRLTEQSFNMLTARRFATISAIFELKAAKRPPCGT